MGVSPGKYLPVSESSGASAFASTAGESASPGQTKVNPFPGPQQLRHDFGIEREAQRSRGGRGAPRLGGDELHLAHADPEFARVGLMVIRGFQLATEISSCAMLPGPSAARFSGSTISFSPVPSIRATLLPLIRNSPAPFASASGGT